MEILMNIFGTLTIIFCACGILSMIFATEKVIKKYVILSAIFGFINGILFLLWNIL